MDYAKLRNSVKKGIKSKAPAAAEKIKQTGGSIGLTVRNLKEKGVQGIGQQAKSVLSSDNVRKGDANREAQVNKDEKTGNKQPEVKIPEIDYSNSDTPPLPPLVQLVHMKQLMAAQQRNITEESEERLELELGADSSGGEGTEEAVLGKFPLRWQDKRGVLVVTNKRLGFVKINGNKDSKGAVKATTGIAASSASSFGSGMVGNVIGSKIQEIPIVGAFLERTVRRQSRTMIKKGFKSAMGKASQKYLSKNNRPNIGLESLQQKKHDLEIPMAEVSTFQLLQEESEGGENSSLSLLCVAGENEHQFTLAHERLYGKIAAFFRKYVGKRNAELEPKVDFSEDREAKTLTVNILR